MGHQGITGGTKLIADRTLEACSLQVFGFHVTSESSAVLRPVGTVQALPHAVRAPTHLVLDGRHELVWTKK